MPKKYAIENEEKLKAAWDKYCAWYIAVEEISEQGHQHFECMVKMRAPDKFWLARDKLLVQYVIGVLAVNKDRELNYVRKSVTKVENGIVWESNVENIENNGNYVWTDIMRTCKSAKEAMEKVRELKPSEYLLKGKTLMESFNRLYGNCTQANFQDNFKIKHFNIWNEKTHLFIGPTGIGKTNFALSHGKWPVHIQTWQHFGKISENSNSCDLIVIDDINLSSRDPHTILSICDKHFDQGIDIKYGTALIPKKLPRIICLNDIKYFWPVKIGAALKAAISRRICIHYFDNTKLYDENASEVIRQKKWSSAPYRKRTDLVFAEYENTKPPSKKLKTNDN